MVSLPRILIAAPASGGGKTTVATGLMAALGARGSAVAGFKVGPDYIDPTYHALATGRLGRNLDAFMCGSELIGPLLAHGASVPGPADVAVIEGVMGLFDGRLGTAGEGSSAQIATLTGTPVILVIDCSHASRTHAAVAAGLTGFDPSVQVAGVILNRVGSARHGTEVASAMAEVGLRVVGQIPRNDDVGLPSRHLGLIPASEWQQSTAKVAALGQLIAEHVDLDAVLEIAAAAPELDAQPWRPAEVMRRVDGEPVVAVAGGRAFTFSYPEHSELLTAAGCRVEIFDPLLDQQLPAGTAAIFVGGGFPELHAKEISANQELLADIRAAAAAGVPIVGECAGLLLLATSLDGHPMSGVLPGTAQMGGRLKMGYRSAQGAAATLLADAGQSVRGHEFHRTDYLAADDAGHDPTVPAWLIDDGQQSRPEGVATANVHASYLHLHWAGFPDAAQRFAQAAADWQANRRSWARSEPPDPQLAVEPDLKHHGDKDMAPGLLDFSVNVAVSQPPDWLVERVVEGAAQWAKYPDSSEVQQQLAEHFGVRPQQLLLTAGAAEAFTLIARSLPAEQPLIVHPQFTEPEAAMLAAGRQVTRHILGPTSGFTLNAAAIPAAADLIIIGNPTNPTGRLHPRAELAKLRKPGRILIVDEAFMDATDGAESMLNESDLTGLIIIRSITKTFGCAGLRTGYVIGEEALIAKLAEQQSPWAVSAPALQALQASVSDDAERHAAAIRVSLPSRRQEVISGLRGLGLTVVDSQAPFVLVDASVIASHSLVGRFAELGVAVRRGESFPGLGPSWLRLAVRDTGQHQVLFDAFTQIIAENAAGKEK